MSCITNAIYQKVKYLYDYDYAFSIVLKHFPVREPQVKKYFYITSAMLYTSGGSSYRDKGIIPTNKFKLIKFLFYFQNLVSLTLHCIKFHFCYITCRLFIIHHYIKFSINVAKYCSYAAPRTFTLVGSTPLQGSSIGFLHHFSM